MANIWTDKRSLNNENEQYAPLRTKQTINNGRRAVLKSSAFSEIKNVINNQIYATPLKGNAAKIDGLHKTFGSTKSLCNEVLRKEQMKQNFANIQKTFEKPKQITEKVITSLTKTYKEPVFDEGLFDSWDIDRFCCKQRKSEEEIWSEMDMIDMDFKNFNFDSCCTEDIKEDLLAIIPELDSIPDIPNIDEIDKIEIDDDEIESPTLKIPIFDDFDDELPF